MVSWNSKLVNFLSNYNCVIINGIKEFISFNALLKKIGLNLFENRDFYEMIYEVQGYAKNHNQEYTIGYNSLIVEYNNGKGLCLGWSSIKQCKDWFEQEPYSVKEILKEIKS